MENRVLATIHADMKLRFKLSHQAGEPGFELIEKSTTNRDVLDIWLGKEIPLDALNKKESDNNKLVCHELMQAAKKQSYDDYLAELTRVIADQQFPEEVRNSAREVLVAVQRQRKHQLPRVAEQELTETLRLTIDMVKTPAMIHDEKNRLVPNPKFTSIAESYAAHAQSFKSSATRKIIGGVMLALLSVAIIVGCSMLIASTFGAGTAIGIPMLVASALVPHFTAGMGLSALAGTGLGFFGIKLFSRAASDHKLGKAMHGLSELKSN